MRYLAGLSTAKVVLYGYLIWWLYTVHAYFDLNPRLWFSSLGLSCVIGTALYLSTAHGNAQPTVLDRWQIFRLYLMPFCVSSFAALIKDRGFVLVLHPTLAANLEAAGCCLGFVAVVAVAKHLVRSIDEGPARRVGSR